jgi:oxaloacetate decarboxylase beta subunit
METFLASIGLLNITIQQITMLAVSILLTFLAIVKKYEPLLLLPISFGMLIANLPMPAVLGIPGLSAQDSGGLM